MKISTANSWLSEVNPLFKLAMPLILNGLVQCAVFFFETIFLAQLGKDILAAGSLVSWLFATIAVIVFGALGAINILVALKHGAKEAENVALIARDGLLQALLLTIPIYLLIWNMAPLLLLFGQPESVVILAKVYLHALSWGIIANFFWIACLEVIMGLGHTRVILAFSVITVITTIIFSYLLIFGKFGFPALGIAGAGWGITIGNWVTLVSLIFYILYLREYRFYFRHVFSFTKPVFLLELLEIGIPMGVMFCFEVAFFFALSLAMGVLGSTVLAANQVAMQYLGLMMSGIFALSQAVTVRMGHLIGAGESTKAVKVNYVGMIMASLFMIFIAIIYWSDPLLLISADFNINNPQNSEIITLIIPLLSISAIFQIVEANRILLFGALRALKDTKFTMLISILSFWGIALPLGYLITATLNMNAIGYWWGMVIGASISVLLLHWRFKHKVKKNYLLSL